MFRVALGGAGCDGLMMVTLRLGVEESLTPWAQLAAGTSNAMAIRTGLFMNISRSKNVREAITVPSRFVG
ncbi:hypothetical protein D6B98_26460 [Bradyrhizobium sp. LVM 105]|nr:hypothetical protein D6B98_26460 [Bradyrhizobium sp. LVM 105]